MIQIIFLITILILISLYFTRESFNPVFIQEHDPQIFIPNPVSFLEMKKLSKKLTGSIDPNINKINDVDCIALCSRTRTTSTNITGYLILHNGKIASFKISCDVSKNHKQQIHTALLQNAYIRYPDIIFLPELEQ